LCQDGIVKNFAIFPQNQSARTVESEYCKIFIITSHKVYNDDDILGEIGNDFLTGDSNSDFIDGGAGNDWLRGGQGSDLLVGGEGNDTLIGDRNVDIYKGGAGSDVFVLRVDQAGEKIIGFEIPDAVIVDFDKSNDSLGISVAFTSSNISFEQVNYSLNDPRLLLIDTATITNGILSSSELFISL